MFLTINPSGLEYALLFIAVPLWVMAIHMLGLHTQNKMKTLGVALRLNLIVAVLLMLAALALPVVRTYTGW